MIFTSFGWTMNICFLTSMKISKYKNIFWWYMTILKTPYLRYRYSPESTYINTWFLIIVSNHYFCWRDSYHLLFEENLLHSGSVMIEKLRRPKTAKTCILSRNVESIRQKMALVEGKKYTNISNQYLKTNVM